MTFLGLLITFAFYYILISSLVFYIALKVTKKRKRRTKILVRGLVVTIILLVPTYDAIITATAGKHYCSTNEKSFIKETNKHPMSIYLEDNVYGGYIADPPKRYKGVDTAKHVIAYLRPNVLETIAFNLKDGRVMVASYDKSLKEYQEYVDAFKKIKEARELSAKYWEELKPKLDSGEIKLHSSEYNKYMELREEQEKIDRDNNILKDRLHPKLIVKTIVEKKDIPKMNYAIIHDNVKLGKFGSIFFNSDEFKIINNKTNEMIGYKRRFYRYGSMTGINALTGRPPVGKYICAEPENLIIDIFGYNIGLEYSFPFYRNEKRYKENCRTTNCFIDTKN